MSSMPDAAGVMPLGGARGAPVRVLIACDRLGSETVRLNGVGRLMVEWSTGFDPGRVRAVCYALRRPGPAGETLRARGVPLRFFGQGRFNPLSVLRFVRVIRGERIEVLHLQDFGASLFGRIAAWLTGVPAIVHVHARYDANTSGYPKAMRLVDRILARRTAAAIAISPIVAEFCVEQMGFRREQVVVVPNPAPRYGFEPPSRQALGELRAAYGLPVGVPVVGVVCRMEKIKGVHILIESFRSVLRGMPDARLLIVGDGPERPALEATAAALGLHDHVIFTGFQLDVAAHLGLMSLLAVPSVWPEPFCLSAVEAMAAGVPVVATATGALPEILRDGEAGLLVPPEQAGPLAEAILRVLKDPALSARLRASGRRRAEDFSLDRHLERLEAIYREAVSSASRTVTR